MPSPELSRSPRYEEPAVSKSCLDVTTADIGQAVNATPADYRQLTGVDKDLLEKIFGKGRLYKKGKSLAREGYVSDSPINITYGGGAAVVKASCRASQRKNVKYKLYLAIDVSSVKGKCSLLQSSCSCPAGREKCVHLSALFHFIAAKASFWRALDDKEIRPAWPR